MVRFIGGVPFTREQSWTRFLRNFGLWQVLGFGFFAIEHKATGALIGECGFHDLRRDIDPSLEGTMEAGWALSGAMHGQGIAVEAMQMRHRLGGRERHRRTAHLYHRSR